MSKQNSYLMIMIAVNLLNHFLLVPYVQTTANSHMNSGAFFGTGYYFISGLLFILALNRLLKQKEYKLFIILLVFALTLTFWGYRLHAIMCSSCLMNG